MKHIPFLFLMLFSIVSLGQTLDKQTPDNDEVTLEKFRKKVVTKNARLQPADLKELVITDRNTSRRSGVQNIYLKQLYNDIEIYNAISSMHLMKTGEVLTVNSQMEANLTKRIKFVEPGISALKVMKLIASEKKYSAKKIKVFKAPEGGNHQQLLTAKGIAEEPIPAKLIYYKTTQRQLTLAWLITVDEANTSNVWDYFVDAQTGKILHQHNNTLN